jgi:epidermal growth factor receptor substrate 15
VWDLSDQDNDSMLSLREFCTALYLMERYREGRPLPAVLPNSIFDLATPGQTMTNYSNAAWRPTSGTLPHYESFCLYQLAQFVEMSSYHYLRIFLFKGFQQQQGMPSSGARHITAAGAARPPRPVAVPQAEVPQANQQKSKVPVLEQHLVNQLSTEEQNSLNLKFQDATEADKKALILSLFLASLLFLSHFTLLEFLIFCYLLYLWI